MIRKIVKALIPRSLFRKIEPWGHLAEAVLFNILYGFPARSLKVIGVTGTNGKTTTSFMIHTMLNHAGYKSGLLTTVGYGVGDEIKPQIEHMTTVSTPVLLKRLKMMKDQGAEWVVLETTSHALAQNRVWGVPYSVAVMTNITHEHLDYHGTFENYRDAKRKLFQHTNHNKTGLRTGVVNADDPSAGLFVSDITHSITYGIKAGDLRAAGVKMTPAGSQYTATFHQQKSTKFAFVPKGQAMPPGDPVYEEVTYNISTNLPGSFNVYNSLAAAGVGIALGLNKEQIEQGIAALKGVEGRMNTVDAGQDFEVIIDYAHTPDSFEKLFKDLKPLVKGKLIVMFGSAGRRDEAKRAVQGRLAGKYADEVILTEEDDRDVPGMEILEQIAAGAEGAGKVRDKDLFLVHDRVEAIQFTIARAKKDDTILLLGKGHEKNIERAHGADPWDEMAEAKKAIKASKK